MCPPGPRAPAGGKGPPRRSRPPPLLPPRRPPPPAAPRTASRCGRPPPACGKRQGRSAARCHGAAAGTLAQGVAVRHSAAWGQAPALTSPSALTRTVRKLSPVPQLCWLFHTSVEGGLWATPAPAAHTWGHRRTSYSTPVPAGSLSQPSGALGVATLQPHRCCRGTTVTPARERRCRFTVAETLPTNGPSWPLKPVSSRVRAHDCDVSYQRRRPGLRPRPVGPWRAAGTPERPGRAQRGDADTGSAGSPPPAPKPRPAPQAPPHGPSPVWLVLRPPPRVGRLQPPTVTVWPARSTYLGVNL